MKPKRLWFFTASSARRALAMSNAIFGRVDFEGEVDVDLVERVQNRQPAAGEVVESALPERLVGRREGVDRVPHRRAGEAVDDSRECVARFETGLGIKKGPGGLGRGDHLARRALAHALGIAVAPHIGRQDGLVALVNEVAHRLSHEVIGNRVAGESVVLEKLPFLVGVFFCWSWRHRHRSDRPNKRVRGRRSPSAWPEERVFRGEGRPTGR